MKKTYVLDTNVFLTNAKSIFEFKNNDLVIPLKVLDEIDKHKKRQDGVGLNARTTIRILDSLRSKGHLHKGVRLGRGKGLLSVRGYDIEDIPPGCDLDSADNEIIGTAITEKKNSHPRKKVIVVTRDINMRVKCDSLGIPTEDYVPNKIISSTNELYKGFVKHLVDDQTIDQFYAGEDVFLDKEDVRLFSNQFVMLVSNANEKKSALARFVSYGDKLKKVDEYKTGIWNLKPRNKEQMFGLDLLLDPSVPIVTLIGKAGCGKTILALAAGLDQILESGTYKKLVVTRPVQPLGKDIGYLPGTMEEKMHPWLMPIQDNLQYLLGDDKATLEMYMEEGIIEVEALTYIRGRSISNAYIIIDEAQNLSVHELKTITQERDDLYEENKRLAEENSNLETLLKQKK